MGILNPGFALCTNENSQVVKRSADTILADFKRFDPFFEHNAYHWREAVAIPFELYDDHIIQRPHDAGCLIVKGKVKINGQTFGFLSINQRNTMESCAQLRADLLIRMTGFIHTYD